VFTLQTSFKPLFFLGGGIKSVRRGDCESKEETLEAFVLIKSKNSVLGLGNTSIS
jgi:hypothetical protein